MLSNSLSRFLRDERGSYTLWSLLWFMIYVAIGGLAVDTTNAYRNETLLQATADAAAVAGAMSLPDEAEAVDAALAYAQQNMNPEYNGYVLTEEDVQLGTWDFDNETFTPGTTDPNAVYVTTRRGEANGNPVGLDVLRFFGLVGLNPWWNIDTEAVAVRGVNPCAKNGLLAGNKLLKSSNNSFHENICLHGHDEGMKTSSNNVYDLGVTASTGCEGCVGPNGVESAIESNEGFADAWANGGPNAAMPTYNADKVGTHIDMLRDLHNVSWDQLPENYQGWDYLYDPDTLDLNGNPSPPAMQEVSALPATLDPYTIYQIDCDGQTSLSIDGDVISNVGIVADCRVHASSDANLQNVVLASDWVGSNPKQDAISFAGSATLGSADCDDPDRATVDIFSASSVSFSAQAAVNNVRIVAAYDVDVAALGDGTNGIVIEAGHNIQMPSNTSWGLCPNNGGGPQEWVFALVR